MGHHPLPPLCQHLGGISVVGRVVSSLLTGTGNDNSVVMLDLLGYDAWPAAFTLTQVAAGLEFQTRVQTVF